MANSEEESIFTHFRITKSQDPFPVKRQGLKAVTWKNSIIVLGGFTDDVTHDPGSECYYHCSGKWLRQETNGDTPPRHFCIGGVVEVLNDTIVVIIDDSRNRWTPYCLCLLTWTWTRLEPGGHPPPAEPFDCKHMSSWVYNEKIFMFGGYGFDEEDELACGSGPRNECCCCEQLLYSEKFLLFTDWLFTTTTFVQWPRWAQSTR